MKTQKRIWIVGGSSGIGLELVKLCLDRGYRVVASSRDSSNTQALLSLKEKFPNTLALVDLDVTKEDYIIDKTKEVWECFDGLDIWFYNAGAYDVMGINDWDIKKFETMNSVNYLGVIRVMDALLPYFKKSNSGHWVWNSSLSSYFGLPKGGAYSAPKAALVNLAQSIQPELDTLNIKLQIINHGFVKTKLTAKNNFKMPQLMEPKFAATKILEGIENPSSFEIRFPKILSLFLSFLRLLPYSLSLSLTKKSL